MSMWQCPAQKTTDECCGKPFRCPHSWKPKQKRQVGLAETVTWLARHNRLLMPDVWEGNLTMISALFKIPSEALIARISAEIERLEKGEKS